MYVDISVKLYLPRGNTASSLRPASAGRAAPDRGRLRPAVAAALLLLLLLTVWSSLLRAAASAVSTSAVTALVIVLLRISSVLKD